MISEKDKSAIINIAKKYKVGRILLFGSSADASRRANDIDLAVEGIPPEKYFKFYGELFHDLSKPVDLIDLSMKSKFTQLVRRDGIVLYGDPERKNRSRTRKYRASTR
jgi:uncharacterized protein